MSFGQLCLLPLQVCSSLVLCFGELLLEFELEVQKLVYHLGVHLLKHIVVNFVEPVDLVGVIWINIVLSVGLLFMSVWLLLVSIRATTLVDGRLARL